jgi:PAS domain S-box-containing protein
MTRDRGNEAVRPIRHEPPQDETRRCRETIDELLDGLPILSWSTDRNLRFVASCGGGFATLEGEVHPRAGAPLGEVLRETAPEAPLRGAHDRALAGRSTSFEAMVRGRTLNGRVVPTRSPEGAITGTTALAIDATDERAAVDSSCPAKGAERILDVAPFALYSARATGEFACLWVSENIEKLTGFPPSAFTKELGFWASRIHPEDRARTLEDFRSLETREGVGVEYRWLCADGIHRWFLDRAVVMRDADGRPVDIVGSFVDVTERRRAEQEALQARTMEALGRLAGAVAHDFNNLLTVILGHAYFLASEAKPDGEESESVAAIVRSAQSASTLTRQLLSFAQRPSTRPRTLLLAPVVRATVPLLRRVLGEEVELETILRDDLPPVLADAAWIEQALLHLALQAREAMDGKGNLRIETSLGGAAASGVRLAVTDTGRALSETERDRLFEPYGPRSGSAEGRGFGLALVYGSIGQCGGRVSVQSGDGRGTTISIDLPAAAPSKPSSSQPDGRESP